MKVFGVFVLAFIIMFLGCGEGKLKIEGSKELFNKVPGLYDVFKEYWSCRAKLDADNAFKFEAPHIQFMIRKKAYRAYINWFGKATLQAIEPYKVECEKDFYCCVDMKMDFVIKKDKKHDIREGRDCWIKVGGKWWHVMRNPLLFLGI